MGNCDRVLTLDFDRDTRSPGKAIGSSVGDVERAGSAVERLEADAPEG